MEKSESSWVDVHNDELMISLGIRPPHLIQRNPSVWKKSEQEKKILKSRRRIHKREMHFNSVPQKSIPVIAKLIIYLRKNNQFSRTTYSTKCWQHDVDDILSNYRDSNSGESLVLKYVYNNITYQPNERPFWI